jgi:RimJ/RimL family protein N-acetyltransferase
VQRLAGDARVADTTLNIPHPYDDGMAESWIGSHEAAFAERKTVVFAITEAGGPLVGAIGLTLELEHRRAELGYWIGAPYWGRGYATEAAAAVIGYGFRAWGLQRIDAHHFVRNPASGRVLEKAGMTREGTHRRRVWKNGRPDDVVVYAILAPTP